MNENVNKIFKILEKEPSKEEKGKILIECCKKLFSKEWEERVKELIEKTKR